MSYFEYYETDSEANPKEKPRRVSYADMKTLLALECPKLSLASVQHYIDLACAAPGWPIDVTRWEAGALVYSGRLVFHAEKHETKPVIVL